MRSAPSRLSHDEGFLLAASKQDGYALQKQHSDIVLAAVHQYGSALVSRQESPKRPRRRLGGRHAGRQDSGALEYVDELMTRALRQDPRIILDAARAVRL